MASRRAARSIAVGDVATVLDRIAPLALAADWDNVGLLAGRPEWAGGRWLVALDLTDAVAREALERRVNGVVLYHPPIFRGTKTVTPDAEGPTALLPDLLAAKISLLATHTAFDAAAGGTNDLLLDAFDIAERWPLTPAFSDGADCKLVVFVPEPELAALRAALAAAGAGVIGAYSECSYALRGQGTFRGDASTHPTVGRRLRLETVDEVRLELVAPRGRLGDIVRALYASHSYEEPAFDLYPLRTVAGRGAVGMGRVGRLRRALRGTTLVERLGQRIDLAVGTAVGSLKRSFERVVAAAGAFGVDAFSDPEALYITGEFKHHDALRLLRRGVTAVVPGHYASEQLVLPALRDRLRDAVPGLEIAVARADRAPFRPLGR